MTMPTELSEYVKSRVPYLPLFIMESSAYLGMREVKSFIHENIDSPTLEHDCYLCNICDIIGSKHTLAFKIKIAEVFAQISEYRVLDNVLSVKGYRGDLTRTNQDMIDLRLEWIRQLEEINQHEW